jgi:hypothetical protein
MLQRSLAALGVVVVCACGSPTVVDGGSSGGGSALGGGAGGGTSLGGGTGGGVATGGSDAGLLVVLDGGITAALETWTWVDFPDAVCGNGAATGLGVNPTSRSDDLLIYLEGGGACWNQLTCLNLHTAANLDTGYTQANFLADPFISPANLARSEPLNPFRDMSYVYVPYCTGDVHAGDAVQRYATRTVFHKGAKNLEAFLARLVATFPKARRVFLAGSSAGAFGAQLNYPRVAAAFPNAEVHVLADCGPMVNPVGTRLTEWLTAWNVTIPAACAGCATDFPSYPRWLASAHPNSRFALLAYEQDTVLSTFFGYDLAAQRVQTQALEVSSYDGQPNARYFVLPDAAHVMLANLYTLVGNGNVSLDGWVSAFVDGGTGWNDVKP